MPTHFLPETVSGPFIKIPLILKGGSHDSFSWIQFQGSDLVNTFKVALSDFHFIKET